MMRIEAWFLHPGGLWRALSPPGTPSLLLHAGLCAGSGDVDREGDKAQVVKAMKDMCWLAGDGADSGRWAS